MEEKGVAAWVFSESEITQTAQKVIDLLKEKHKNLLLLSGDLGAGKTTLTQALCACKDYNGKVSSPSFGLINVYPINKGVEIAHMDAYRLTSIEEAQAIGVEEYWDNSDLSVVEWPEKMADLLREENCIHLHLHIIEGNKRKLQCFDTFTPFSYLD